MDDIVEDTRREVEVLLTAWQTQGAGNDGIFRPRVSDTPKSDNSSEFYDDIDEDEDVGARSQVRFVVSDLSRRNQKDDDSMEINKMRSTRMSSAVSPGTVGEDAGGSDYFEVACAIAKV